MGLVVSHDCWDGSYSSFMEFRKALAQAAGLPELETMAGFTSPGLSWAPFEQDALCVLLNHPDSWGEIAAEDCEILADRLDEVLQQMPPGRWRQAAAQFSVGLRAAVAAGEGVEFG